MDWNSHETNDVAPLPVQMSRVTVIVSEVVCSILCISVQECGKQLSDKPGSQCFPLDSHLLCHSCHMSRVCASQSLPPHNTHWMGERPAGPTQHCFVICMHICDQDYFCHSLKYLLFSHSFPPPAHTLQDCNTEKWWSDVIDCFVFFFNWRSYISIVELDCCVSL